MKNYIVLIYCVQLMLSACEVDYEVQPSFRNDIRQFRFVKMDFQGEYIEKNLSLYWPEARTGYTQWSKDWIDRRYVYRADTNGISPYENYFDNLSWFGFSFNTNTSEDLKLRIGSSFPITDFYLNDNYISVYFISRNKSYTSEYDASSRLTYLDYKDTLIGANTYELTHLRIDKLNFTDDDGGSFVVSNLEMRQLLERR